MRGTLRLFEGAWVILTITAVFLAGCQGGDRWEDYQGGTEVVLVPDTVGDQQKDTANVLKAGEIIRKRMKELEIRSMIETRPESRQIVLQFPPVEDLGTLMRMIGSVAFLEFRLVDDTAAAGGGVPADDELVESRDRDKETGLPVSRMLLKKRALLKGDSLKSARVYLGGESGKEPYISIEFDKEGAKAFERITAENVGKRLAIVIDNKIFSAPIITDKITDGYAMITGTMTMVEAKNMAIALRAGRYPVEVKIGEPRTLTREMWLGNKAKR